MPVYEFKCLACDCKFNRKVEYNPDPVHGESTLFVTCPRCGGKAMRSFSITGITFYVK